MSYYDVDWSPRFGFGGPRSLANLIGVCIHTTENSAGTPAENVANYQLNSKSGSYHVVVDTRGVRLRENTDDWITWSTGNRGNYVLVHLSFVAYAAWSRAQWLAEDKMLRAGATVVAYWCKTHGWPVRRVSVNGLPGITTHNDTRAWGSTDHTDPGPNFPWDVFLRYVNESMGGGNAPAPAPSKENKVDKAQADRIEHMLRLVLEQLAGREVNGKQEWNGWPQGGQRTQYDLLAAVAEALEVPGTEDTKASGK